MELTTQLGRREVQRGTREPLHVNLGPVGGGRRRRVNGHAVHYASIVAPKRAFIGNFVGLPPSISFQHSFSTVYHN